MVQIQKMIDIGLGVEMNLEVDLEVGEDQVNVVPHFKVDTGADGSLLPLGEFFKHFPEANLNDLAKTADLKMKLYAYYDTEIKQLGVCELLVEYQKNRKICEFYVVDFLTAILGIHDSESLKLLTVHFNSVETKTSHLRDDSSSSMPMYANAIKKCRLR